MCYAILWYHALCQHLDDSLSSLISCDSATLTGDDCLAHQRPIVSLPLSGSCSPCKDEHTIQKAETNMNLGIETQPQEIEQDNLREVEGEKWAHEPEPIPGYHTHLYPKFEEYDEPTSWLDLEEVEVEVADYEHLLPSEHSRQKSVASSPEIETDWFRREFAFPDSPTLGYIAGRWDPSSRSLPGRWQSMIHVPAARNGAGERVWDDSELDLFDRLTF